MFTALLPLKSDFTSGWETVKKVNLVPSKSETIGQKVKILLMIKIKNCIFVY